MTVSQLPAQTFGLLFMGGAAGVAPFGDGLRCIAPGGVGVFRYPFFSTMGTGGAGASGIAGFACNTFAPAGCIAPGQTWYYQAWYRDGSGTCGLGFNLSNGLEILFTP